MADVTLTSDIDATWTNSGGPYDAGELRRADAAMFSSGGVARGLDVTVTASDEVRVAAGSWVIDGDETSEGAGVYRGGIASQASANLEARDATYGRIDLVVARQYDPDVVGSHTNSFAAVEVLTGTPSANPSAPALPDLAIALARLDVPADGGGAVAVDTTGRRYAAVRLFSSYLYVWHNLGGDRAPGSSSGITWTDVEEATGGAAASGSVLTFGPPGIYHVSAQVVARNSTGGNAGLALRDSDTDEPLVRAHAERAGSDGSVVISAVVRVSEGQRFRLHLGASSGVSGTTEFYGGKDRFFLTAARVGD